MLIPIVVLALTLAAPQQDAAWAPLQFLAGDWTGEGGGGPGQGSGEFSFQFDLQGKVLVRKNVARYPAAQDKPAVTHDDLMVVYLESGKVRADYYDSEGHVIRYAVTPSTAGNTAQFLSDAQPSSPRYRLTYSSTGKDSLAIRFEIAPPGKPGAFATYIEAKARRK